MTNWNVHLAVYRTVYDDVHGAVYWAVFQIVNRAVCGVLQQAVHRAVFREPPHPGLERYLETVVRW